MDRRNFLRAGLAGGTFAVIGTDFLGSALPGAFAATSSYGALQAADANGIRLPAGFTSRVIARSGQAVAGTSYTWPGAPDGGACFARSVGGWTYVANSELSSGAGGASSIDFNSAGTIVAARRILGGTTRNCAGGPTPWGRWLSCEETSTGRVWECDPTGASTAVARPAMGRFNHEAAAVDPVRQYIYLTEDASDGKLYRFRPTTWPNLSSGTLQVATVSGSTVTWKTVPDPDGSPTPTRSQVAGSTSFNGGEGAWYGDNKVWFTTKGDNKVWELNVGVSPQTIRVIYDDNTSPTPVLTGVDNIVGRASGQLFVGEDGGNMEICVLEPSGAVSVFLRVANQSGSEITGPAFNPAGDRLYFSSQRGPTGSGSGITYEVRGPFV